MNIKKTNTCIALALAICLLLPTIATAQTDYLVNSLEDEPGNQSSDRDGLVTLREAVIAANLDRAFGDAPAGGNRALDTIRFSQQFTSKDVLELNAQLEVMGSAGIRIIGKGPQNTFMSGRHQNRLFRVFEDGKLILDSLTLMNGRANLGTGGAILVQQSTLNTYNVEIVDCLADYGGGIGAEGFSIVNFDRSTIISNWATHSGGGIYGTDRAVISVENSTLTKNHANYNGGGVCLDHVGITPDDFMLQLYSRNSTIVENRTGFGAWITGNGGGVCVLGWPEFWDGKMYFDNTILAKNVRYLYRGTTPDDAVGKFTRSNNNLIGAADAIENEISNGVQGNLVGTTNNPLDPRLGALQIGYTATLGYGSTHCYVPLGSSPAINAGSNSAVYTSTDQRGNPRIRYGTVDIGSTER